MPNLNIKCVRCGSSNVIPATHEKGNKFALGTVDQNNVISENEFLFVKVDVCQQCGEISLHLPR